MRDWTFDELPELMEVSVGSGQRVLGYPGLVDDGDSVSLRVYDTPAEAQQAHRAGLAAAVHAAVPRTTQVSREEPAGAQPDGDAVHGARHAR
jgi:hypothetical protein